MSPDPEDTLAALIREHLDAETLATSLHTAESLADAAATLCDLLAQELADDGVMPPTPEEAA